jgi:TnpA family transposase
MHNLTPLEMDEYCSLLPGEMDLLANKNGANRIGFAVLLKFFQHEGRFPSRLREVPPDLVDHIARQVKVGVRAFERYRLHDRNVRNHKDEIREFTGFRKSTVQDAESVKEWVCVQVVGETDPTLELLTETVYARFRELKLEPPSPDRVTRIAGSALNTLESSFFTHLADGLIPEVKARLDGLLEKDEDGCPFYALKAGPGRVGLESAMKEIEKLKQILAIGLPIEVLGQIPEKVLRRYKLRVAVESLHEMKRHPDAIRYALLAMFCHTRSREIHDALGDLLIQIVHKIGARSERTVEKELLADIKKVAGKGNLLFLLANTSIENPDELVREAIYPVVGEQTLHDIIEEYRLLSHSFQEKVFTRMRSSYSHHYRRLVPEILSAVDFRSNNDVHQPVIQALGLIRKYAGSKQHYYPSEESIPIKGALRKSLEDLVLEKDTQGEARVNRINYEIGVLQALRDRLRCKEIWIKGANRYRDPDQDLPGDFDERRDVYYQALHKTQDVETFIADLQQRMSSALETLDTGIPRNKAVKVKTNGWIALSPLTPQEPPPSILKLKAEIGRRWPLTSLLDIVKETDLRVDFTSQFKGTGSRESLDPETLRRRLLICLFGLGTNTGFKRLCDKEFDEEYQDLLYIRRRYLHPDCLRSSIAMIVNAIFQARRPIIWGEGTTACASDSKKFGAWNQNLMTEWHVRYGGRGVMIYWHVEKKSVCIYSQLKTCSSSEVAAMIEGLLRHCTEMAVEKNYVDSHGQSEVAFAFCHLLNFQLLPRLKGIHRQKLYRPFVGQSEAYQNLQPILTRPINWDLIRRQYDQMVKYATALRLGTAETEAILKRFTRNNLKHPTYQALCELGKAVKTIFLCNYLNDYDLRQEINEGLNVVEQWNSVNGFIFYGKSGEFATNRMEDQEVAMLSLHLLQISMAYINTLMIQQVLSEPKWLGMMKKEDFRALTPLIYAHINPYGVFKLNMDERLLLEPERGNDFAYS